LLGAAGLVARDADGNAISPLFDRLWFFDVDGTPLSVHARGLEAALRTFERTYRGQQDRCS
jgi:hypothetical protein